MKCPQCGKMARVIDTRREREFTYRRQECTSNHRFTTREFLWDATSKDVIQKLLSAARKSGQTTVTLRKSNGK